MTEPDRLCIICLEVLPLAVENPPSVDGGSGQPAAAVAAGAGATATTKTAATTTFKTDTTTETESDPLLNKVASLDGCDHVLHDGCIRLWAQKTNTCPICREAFRTIRVFDGVNGPAVESYEVEEKKQVAEFDPQQWLAENPDEEDPEPETSCPVCNSNDREDVLLLCDACDAAYHTYCIGMNQIPLGNWYCIECADTFAPQAEEDEEEPEQSQARGSRGRPRRALVPGHGWNRSSFPRTRARMRRARRQARSLDWAGPWGRFAGRVYDALQLDLDNHEGDDDALEEFRRTQQQREQERREYQRWQQRLSIASRLGARDAFASSIPLGARQQLRQDEASHLPQPVRESRDEVRAWGALERARETEQQPGNSNSRKRRAPTASPTEAGEPERKLKRPCTRRRFLPAQNEASSSSTSAPAPAAGPSSRPVENGLASGSPPLPEGPSFLSALLKEVETSTASDDEAVRHIFGRSTADATSPATSPSLSAQASPRALSLTPPPLMNGQMSSPSVPLSSYVEPIYPPTNYSPTRPSDSETRPEPNVNGSPQILEIRQPRPRRPHMSRPKMSPETSPARQPPLSPEAKANINGIVRSALRPHWHAKELTTEQYSTINRDVSRKLYEEIKGDPSTLDDAAMKSWEVVATSEVARAVAESKA